MSNIYQKNTGDKELRDVIKLVSSSLQNESISIEVPESYRKKDGALDRRFQKVVINPPSPEEAVHILKNIREIYHLD